MTHKHRLGTAGYYVVSIVLAVIALIPFLWMISTSLKSRGALMSIPIEWIPSEPTLDGYAKVFSRFPFLRTIGNSLLISVAYTLITLISASMAAFAFAKLRFRGSGFATVAPKKGSTVHGLVWKITPNCEQSLDRYEGYPRHYTKETVTVKDAAGAELPVMVYIMAEPYCRQPALPSPYYYRVIQRGFEANGLPVESLQAAWSRTIDEVWSGRIDKPKRAPERNRGPER